MARPVCCIVYPIQNGTVMTGSTTEDKRALRDLRASLTAHYGRDTGTTWGDKRGRDAEGNQVEGYSITMEVEKANTPWFYGEFWGSDGSGFVEVINGVGYFNKTSGRAPFFTLDRDDYEGSVRSICETLGIEFVQHTNTRTARKPSTPVPTDPFGSVGDLLKLIHTADPEFDVMSNLGTPREELVAIYMGLLPTEDEASSEESTENES